MTDNWYFAVEARITRDDLRMRCPELIDLQGFDGFSMHPPSAAPDKECALHFIERANDKVDATQQVSERLIEMGIDVLASRALAITQVGSRVAASAGLGGERY